MGSTLNAALFYASLGWPIIPVWSVDINENGKATCHCGNPECGSPGKHPVSRIGKRPVVVNGIKDATTDPRLIQRWWSLYPGANIGAAGCVWFALDIDREEARFELPGKIPDTVESISGSGGQHILFKQPDDWKVGNGTGTLPDGIDVRGCGPDGSPRGYIVLPPSLHPSGNRYEWELSSHPRDVNVAEAPQWLLDILKDANKPKEHVTITQCDAPDLAIFDISKPIRARILSGHSEGENFSRKDMAVCCALVEAGATPSEVASIFRAYPIGTQGKLSKHDSPEQYLQATIESAFSWTSQKSPRKTIRSKVQPNQMVTKEEALHEDRALNLAYMQGWSDALQSNPSIVPDLWPDYLELRQETYANYGIGCNFEYADHHIDGHTSGALVVPYYVGSEIETLDMTIYSPPENYPDRIWQTDSGASIFDTEFMRAGQVTGSAVVVGDFDEALILQERGLKGFDIVAQAASGQLGGPKKRVEALAEFLARAERVSLCGHTNEAVKARR